MIEILEIRNDIPGSSANALHAISHDGTEWVLRLKKKDKNARRLMNEFVAAGLACRCGINRPKAVVAHIAEGLIPSRHAELFTQQKQFGIAVEYIKNIKNVSPPEDNNPLLPDFPKINRNHLRPLYEQSDNLGQLYGYFVFSNWIQLADNYKYENLLIDQENNFVFLDMDCAFGGARNECEMKEYEWHTIPKVAPFLEGIIEDSVLCADWLNAVRSVSIDYFQELVNEIRGKIEFSENCVTQIGKFLFDQKEQFFSAFKSALTAKTF